MDNPWLSLLGIGIAFAIALFLLLLFLVWLSGHTKLGWKIPSRDERAEWIHRALDVAEIRFAGDELTDGERISRMTTFMNDYFEAYHVRLRVTEAEVLIFATENSVPTIANALRKTFGGGPGQTRTKQVKG